MSMHPTLTIRRCLNLGNYETLHVEASGNHTAVELNDMIDEAMLVSLKRHKAFKKSLTAPKTTTIDDIL